MSFADWINLAVSLVGVLAIPALAWVWRLSLKVHLLEYQLAEVKKEHETKDEVIERVNQKLDKISQSLAHIEGRLYSPSCPIDSENPSKCNKK